MECKICGNRKDNHAFEVREMMLGYRDSFLYLQCSHCGCLQIAEIPSNISKYYPSTYYSYTQSPLELFRNPIKKIAKRFRDRYAIFDRGVLGRLLYDKFPNESLRSLCKVADLTKETRILDVGCGSGALLYTLKERGFKNLLGIDPFLEEDIAYGNGLKILKQTIFNLAGDWDVIMFHHSFEHFPDPVEVLQCAARLLSPKGVCIIRTPTVSSYAWEHYGVNWVQLDAPRHCFLYAVKSMKIITAKASLKLERVVYDSTDFQFWGSEQYLRDIPLISERSYAVNPSNSIFSRQDIKHFKRKAKQLNRENRGDMAAFYLSRES